jgi:ankyrin repeat protein
VGSNQKEYIRLLVSKGIDINSQDDNGNTALHYPLNNVLRDKMYLPYSTGIVKILIEEGADPQIKNKEGKSPMDIAVESEENELINLLKSSKSMN